MTETLLSISEVELFGNKMTDMTYKEKKGDPKKHFVRVQGFGFESNYYLMDAPIIMLLETDGEPIPATLPTDIRNSLPTDIKMWTRDKSDSSVRLDELAGTFEEILLELELGGSASSGSVSGGRVSGGRVSGGRVSGGRVSGGRVSGGKAD